MFRSGPFYIEKHIGVEVHLMCLIFRNASKKCDFEWRAFSPFDMHLPEKIPWLLICDLSRQNFIFIRLSRYTMYNGNSRKFTFWLQPLATCFLKTNDQFCWVRAVITWQAYGLTFCVIHFCVIHPDFQQSCTHVLCHTQSHTLASFICFFSNFSNIRKFGRSLFQFSKFSKSHLRIFQLCYSSIANQY